MLTVLLSIALAADLSIGPTQAYATLDEALDDALDGDRLLVDPGTYTEPTLDIDSRSLTVEATAPGVRIESEASRRAFTIAGGTLTLIGLEVDGLDNVGIAEVRTGTLMLSGVTVLAARAPINGQPGGSIDAEDATITIVDSVLDGAVAPVKDGGHIYALRSAITVRDSVLRGGSADKGGAIYLAEGALLVERSSFESNQGDTSGSAIYAEGASLQVIDSSFVGNNASQRGTIQCLDTKSCSIAGTLFEANTSGAAAAVDASNVGLLEIIGSTACRTAGTGTLVEVSSSAVTIQGTVLTSLDTTDSTVVFDGSTIATLVNNSLVLNSTSAALIEASGDLTLTNNLIASTNSAGPAIAASGPFSGGYNHYFANAGGDISPGLLATDVTGVDPLIGSPQPDSCALDPLRPVVGSPLVDAGDPSILDDDGSPSDIGAFGGDSANGGVDGLDEDADGFSSPLDCDDTNPTVNPAAAEVLCNGLDDDCDPATNDDADADADGISVCNNDCDDSDPLVAPGQTERDCNGVDDDCDPSTPDGPDEDGDGVAACEGDCVDTDPNIFPGQTEVDCNGLDDDCNPDTVDAVDEDADGVSVCDGDCDDTNDRGTFVVDVYYDADYDGYGVGDPTPLCVVPTNSAPVDGDCNNADPTIYPGAPEVPYDGIDQDCDGSDLDDLDGDGALGAVDCDDNDPTRYPGADDTPDDGIDQDCTGNDVSATLVGASGWRCGCSSTTPAGGWLAALLTIGAVTRRRRLA